MRRLLRWQGSFYPSGMKSREFLSYYATQFATVEVDSTFYGCPFSQHGQKLGRPNSWRSLVRGCICRLAPTRNPSQKCVDGYSRPSARACPAHHRTCGCGCLRYVRIPSANSFESVIFHKASEHHKNSAMGKTSSKLASTRSGTAWAALRYSSK